MLNNVFKGEISRSYMLDLYLTSFWACNNDYGMSDFRLESTGLWPSLFSTFGL